MKVRISDLFEDVAIDAEAIRLQEDASIDKDRIRQLVLAKIGGGQDARAEPHPAASGTAPAKAKAGAAPSAKAKAVLVAAALAAMLTFALAANAATGGKLLHAVVLTKDNRHIADKAPVAAMEEVPPGGQPASHERQALTSDIIGAPYLTDLPAGTITNVPVKLSRGKFAIPEVLTTNGDLVIFTKKDKSGWHLEKGEKLTVRFALDLASHDYSDPNGERMEVGFVRNGEPVSGYFDKAKTFAYTVTADEAGDYYFYVENWTAGYVTVTSGSIESVRL